jgi:shikimate dehydrogenase
MTRQVVLLGEGIGYSASPAIHNAAFAAVGIDAEYNLWDIAEDEVADAVDRIRTVGYLGANVTRPHKRAVCSLVDRSSDDVERLGAANTLVHLGAQLIAYNTDLAAVREELAELRQQPGGTAVVLGDGGASAAAQAALGDLGWRNLRVVSRERWAELESALRDAEIVVNATPVGTDSDASPIPSSWLRGDLAVLDLVYRPSLTRLVREARAIGAPARGGAGTLLRQGAASFRLWTGLPAPMEPMRAALRNELGATAGV